ncbi:MAG: hypothetical protein AAGU12_16405 [Clostridiales bacterium]
MNRRKSRYYLKKPARLIILSLFFLALGFFLGRGGSSSLAEASLEIQFYTGTLPEYFLSDQEQILYMLPLEAAPEATKLPAYTMVNCYDRVLCQGEVWLYVDTPVFDIPAPNAKGWVKESQGIPYTEEVHPLLVFPLYLKEEAEYPDPHSGPLLIEERKEDQVYLTGAGGWANWIAIDDLRYPDLQD